MIHIRQIEESDNPIVAHIIREVLTEFGANKPGFAWQDPELDAMAQAYDKAGHVYQVVEEKGEVVGGAGIGEFICHLPDCCELQKMYLLPEGRGKGLGEALIKQLLSEAKSLGYQYCYLETLSSMKGAIGLYRKAGFKALDEPLGDSGHNACDEWYLLDLNEPMER